MGQITGVLGGDDDFPEAKRTLGWSLVAAGRLPISSLVGVKRSLGADPGSLAECEDLGKSLKDHGAMLEEKPQGSQDREDLGVVLGPMRITGVLTDMRILQSRRRVLGWSLEVAGKLSIPSLVRPLDADLESLGDDGGPDKSLEDYNHVILADYEDPSSRGPACLAPAHCGAVSVLSTHKLVCNGTIFQKHIG